MSSQSPSNLPSRAPRGRVRWWWIVVGSGLLFSASLLVLLLLARHEPEFYATSRAGAAVGADADAVEAVRQRGAGRFLSKVAALAADVGRPGEWSTVIAEDELNAWLAGDLPANHPELLPAGVEDLRVQFGSGVVLLGCRLGGPLAGLAWAEVRLRLLEANRLAMTVEQCRMGLLPLPAGVASSQLADGLKRAGLRCEMLRIAGQTELVAQLPAAEIEGNGGVAVSWWLDGLRIEEGEVFLTGSSRQVDSGRRGSAF